MSTPPSANPPGGRPGANPPPAFPAIHFLAELDKVSQNELAMLDTVAEAVRACLLDLESRSAWLSLPTPDPADEMSVEEVDYLNRYNQITGLSRAVSSLLEAERGLRGLLLQAVPRDAGAWRQRAVEVQDRMGEAFEATNLSYVRALNRESKRARIIFETREVRRVQVVAEGEQLGDDAARD